MLKKTMIAVGFTGAMVVTLSSSTPYIAAGAEVQADQWNCMHTCNDCQKSCQSLPAGSKQTDCMRGCTANAAGCCSSFGKKPPSGLTCSCE